MKYVHLYTNLLLINTKLSYSLAPSHVLIVYILFHQYLSLIVTLRSKWVEQRWTTMNTIRPQSDNQTLRYECRTMMIVDVHTLIVSWGLCILNVACSCSKRSTRSSSEGLELGSRTRMKCKKSITAVLLSSFAAFSSGISSYKPGWKSKLVIGFGWVLVLGYIWI